MQLITQHHHHHHHHHHHQQQQHDTKSTIPNIPPYFNTNCTVLDIKYTTRYQTKQVIYKMHHLKYQTHHPNPKYSIPNRKITIFNSEHLIPITSELPRISYTYDAHREKYEKSAEDLVYTFWQRDT